MIRLNTLQFYHSPNVHFWEKSRHGAVAFKFTENLKPVPKISLSCQWLEVRLPSFAIIASTLSPLYRIFNAFSWT